MNIKILTQEDQYKGVELTVKEGIFRFYSHSVVKDFYEAVFEYLKKYRPTNLFINYDKNVEDFIGCYGFTKLFIIFDTELQLTTKPQSEGVFVIANYCMTLEELKEYGNAN